MQQHYFKTVLYCLLLGAAALSSCTKFLEAEPPKNQLPANVVFTDSASVVGALSHIYTKFGISAGTIESYFSAITGLYADEIWPVNASSNDQEYYGNTITTNNSINAATWQSLYAVVYECNALLEGIDNNTALTATLTAQCSAEAKFLRAFAYFLLVNCYGDVPLVLSTDVQATSLQAKIAITEVYSEIVNDLEDAENTAVENYPSSKKIRANKWAAAALLAKVHLYLKNWKAAEEEATLVINSGIYTPLEAPGNVFLAGSKETILQFYEQYGYTWSGTYFQPFFGSLSYAIVPGLLGVFSDEDLRRQEWVGEQADDAGNVYAYPAKYKNSAFVTVNMGEYTMCLRAAEQYIIRAEARCNQDAVEAAVSDINVIRNRAGIEAVVMPVTKDSCLHLIAAERQRELFTEWGNRFFDLKRTGEIDKVLSAEKPSWRPEAALYPVPSNEIIYNPSLNQNPGY